ncbi:MAG TPA: phosphoribosylaminoimidazolesuccinocarboxamide synthase, partial [Terrimesophilobacter sp.]|nr:phosphoribosylaminoimidazolesuccinocarboxamide synthase [Terrimesophilobacter sp.]
SSRYWDLAAWRSGERGSSFDKQVVRNWLKANWDGHGNPPELPSEVVADTATRYEQLADRLIT